MTTRQLFKTIVVLCFGFAACATEDSLHGGDDAEGADGPSPDGGGSEGKADDLPPTPADPTDPADPPDEEEENCTGAQPTSIGGDIYGYPDKFSVNASIGVHLVDAAGRSVDGAGTLCSVEKGNCNGASNYAYFIRANPRLSELGATPSEPGMTRRWSRCVSPKVTRMYLEGYPRNPDGKTDHTKYASTMSNRVNVAAGSTVRYSMRFPVTFEHGGGNTGNVNGWAMCNDRPTPVVRINGWTAQPSTACGIRAYQSGGNIKNENGYWWIGPFAAGQCGASSQPVNIVAHVKCNGVPMRQTKQVDIVRGKTIGAVNLYFP